MDEPRLIFECVNRKTATSEFIALRVRILKDTSSLLINTCTRNVNRMTTTILCLEVDLLRRYSNEQWSDRKFGSCPWYWTTRTGPIYDDDDNNHNWIKWVNGIRRLSPTLYGAHWPETETCRTLAKYEHQQFLFPYLAFHIMDHCRFKNVDFRGRTSNITTITPHRTRMRLSRTGTRRWVHRKKDDKQSCISVGNGKKTIPRTYITVDLVDTTSKEHLWAQIQGLKGEWARHTSTSLLYGSPSCTAQIGVWVPG